VTTSGISISRDGGSRTIPPEPAPAPAKPRRSKTTGLLFGAALALVALIVGYVVFYVRGR
jgi:uncharacterized protein HemX